MSLPAVNRTARPSVMLAELRERSASLETVHDSVKSTIARLQAPTAGEDLLTRWQGMVSNFKTAQRGASRPFGKAARPTTRVPIRRTRGGSIVNYKLIKPLAVQVAAPLLVEPIQSPGAQQRLALVRKNMAARACLVRKRASMVMHGLSPNARSPETNCNSSSSSSSSSSGDSRL